VYGLFRAIEKHLPLTGYQLEFAQAVFIVEDPVEELQRVGSKQISKWNAQARDKRPVVSNVVTDADFRQDYLIFLRVSATTY